MHFFLLLSLFLSLALGLAAQPVVPSGTSATVLIDAIATRGAIGDERARVDVYLSVPYQSLQFEAANGSHAAQYKVHIVARDSISRKVIDSTYTRSVVEAEYSITRGSTGKADNSIRTFVLAPGTYRIEVTVSDQFSRREYEQTRPLVVPDFTNDVPNLSSIMYLKEVEQRGERYRITPTVGDAIWSLDAPLFAFTEVYTDKHPMHVALSWKITSADGKVLARGLGPSFLCSLRTQQTFVPITLPARSLAGSYTLTLHLHPTTSAATPDAASGGADTSTTLATRSRPLTIPRSITSSILSDLDKAVKQLIYVADQSDLDHIRAAIDDADRQRRFEDFWKKLDPTPSTVRNEAFEDYYARIEAANNRYRSYSEGWLTDMGRVYIIYGEPNSVDRFTAQSGTTVRIVWTYLNNTTFTFDDTTGFGDYRLRTTLPPGIRYRYRR